MNDQNKSNKIYSKCYQYFYNKTLMHRCQHNQKISLFCASECCVWKQAGGCLTCIKKYHNHMGQTNFLKEEDVQNIVKKLIIDPNSKPKCRLIQQQIYNYFTTVKNQLSSSIQILCKTIINQLGYPYLNKNNNLFAFKRLKNKEYKKINQKEFRNLYELSKRIDLKQVSKQQNKIYMEQLSKNINFLQQIQGLMQNYQDIIKKMSPSFHHQSNSVKKVVQLMNQVISSTNKSSSKYSNASSKKPQQIKQDKKTYEQMTSPINKLKNIQLKYSSTPTKHSQPPQLQFDQQKQKPTKDHYREVSLDKKVNEKKKFTLLLDQIKSEQNSSKIVFSTQRQNNLTVIQNASTLIYASQKIESGGSRKQFFNKEQQINSRKQKLIQMMKHKQITVGSQPVRLLSKQIKRQPDIQTPKSIRKQQRPNERFSDKSKEKYRGNIQKKDKDESPTKNYLELNNSTISQIFKQSSQTSNSLQSSSQMQFIKKLIPTVNMYAHSKLPIEDHEEKLKQIAIQKLIVVPAFRDIGSRIGQCDSPLLKKKQESRLNQTQGYSFKIQTIQKGMSKSLQENYRSELDSPPKNIQVQIRQNEQKSLALLVKSINLKANQAIAYLEASLKYAPNNLSAAQYLTYLYLQSGKALECLHVCNSILDKFEMTKDLQVILVNLNNNKSAALNILGRYSQAIVLLQKTLKIKQKQTLFKNLGDAYFLNGNIQKSIFNYQKAIKFHSNYDQAYYNLAACLYSQQNYNNARLWINKACELCPKKSEYVQLKKYIDERVKKTEIQF